ncbi:hypothetical protein [Paludisphaera soli]|uniref:hypothetical protein n=1 Tax=Paludisphaera soli TaxID=2712865 RepID=UPI0013EBDD6F|nr:hypothetical protein [Paludisphaera soli]
MHPGRSLSRRIASLAILGSLVLAPAATAEGPSQFRAANIPRGAFEHLQLFGASGIQAFAVAPNGGWAVVSGDGRIAMDGTPPGFDAELRTCVQQGHRILNFAFTHAGGWTLFTDRAFRNSNVGVPQGCLQRQEELAEGGKLLAVSYGKDDSWVVTSDRGGVFTNIGPGGDFEGRIRAFVERGPIRAVALAPGGGASVLIDGRRYDAKSLPGECFKAIEEAAAEGFAVDNVTLTPNGGWAVIVSRPRE